MLKTSRCRRCILPPWLGGGEGVGVIRVKAAVGLVGLERERVAGDGGAAEPDDQLLAAGLGEDVGVHRALVGDEASAALIDSYQCLGLASLETGSDNSNRDVPCRGCQKQSRVV
jgi:hypothetical protein